jgi:ATPase subunit of ABC transporter with duplicated ATPase domains
MSQVNITNLTFAYPGSFNNIFENVNISFDTDWKIGFIGRNGRGKTTFMNILLENLEYSGKSIKIDIALAKKFEIKMHSTRLFGFRMKKKNRLNPMFEKISMLLIKAKRAALFS